MKRLFTVITSFLGVSAAAAPETKMVDPRTLYYSIPTINDALPATTAQMAPGANDLVLHEDDWRQFEAIAVRHRAEMQQELAGVQRILRDKSKVSGQFRIFSEIHIRKRIVQPLPTPLGWNELLAAAGLTDASVANLGLRGGQGMVTGGFAFRVGDLAIYGVRRDEHVEVLCFDSTPTPGLNKEAAQRLATFFDKAGVVLVHWPSATVLDNVEQMTAYLTQQGEEQFRRKE